VQLPKRLKELAPKGWLHATLSVQRPDAEGWGLAGSGIFVVNPPYTLHRDLRAALPWLKDALAQHEGASWHLEQRVA
jgi:23S rRNA (adenine2030-N6)-methyltransferase